MKRSGFWVFLAVGLFLAACGRIDPGAAPAVQTTASLASSPAPVTLTPASEDASATPVAPTGSPSPSPTPTATPIPLTLYNRYMGRDAKRQPELVQTPLAEILPISAAGGYARSYIAIFLDGKLVNGDPIRGDRAMLSSLIRLFDDAYKAGHTSQTVLSSYRSYAEQAYLGQQDVEENGKFLAEPGRSEHQLGTALDLAWQTDRLNFYIMNLDPRARAFYNWLKANAQLYGFVFSYPYKSSPDQVQNNLLEPYVTEYKAEPWHLRYVGPDLAAQIFSATDSAGRNYLDPLSTIIPQQYFLP